METKKMMSWVLSILLGLLLQERAQTTSVWEAKAPGLNLNLHHNHLSNLLFNLVAFSATETESSSDMVHSPVPVENISSLTICPSGPCLAETVTTDNPTDKHPEDCLISTTKNPDPLSGFNSDFTVYRLELPPPQLPNISRDPGADPTAQDTFPYPDDVPLDSRHIAPEDMTETQLNGVVYDHELRREQFPIVRFWNELVLRDHLEASYRLRRMYCASELARLCRLAERSSMAAFQQRRTARYRPERLAGAQRMAEQERQRLVHEIGAYSRRIHAERIEMFPVWNDGWLHGPRGADGGPIYVQVLQMWEDREVPVELRVWQRIEYHDGYYLVPENFPGDIEYHVPGLNLWGHPVDPRGEHGSAPMPWPVELDEGNEPGTHNGADEAS